MNGIVKKVISIGGTFLLGAGVSALVVKNTMQKKVDQKQNMSDKHLDLFLIMNRWVKLKQEGREIIDYFKKNNYKHIAIYGMSYMGETLINELKNSDVEIVYAIDKNADNIFADVEVVGLDEELEEVDVIIVTAVSFFEEVKELLVQKIDCPIVSLEEILCDV